MPNVHPRHRCRGCSTGSMWPLVVLVSSDIHLDPVLICIPFFFDSVFHGQYSLFLNQTRIVLAWYDIHFSSLDSGVIDR